MDAAQVSALKGDRKASFAAIEIVLPDDTLLRLCSGGFVAFDVDGDSVAFDSEHADFGTLGHVDPVRTGTEASVVATRIILYPLQSGLALLTAAGVQRSKVRIWEGTVSADTGAVQGEPDLIFIGELNYPDAPRGRNTGALVLHVSSQEYFQQVPNDQDRLNDAWLRSVYGSDVAGLVHVQRGVTRKRYWQQPRPSISYGAGSGGGGGIDPNISLV